MPETAQYFQASNGHPLFGVVSTPATELRNVGVVFCHPSGEEKQKSYRAFVEFARALASDGIPSLRYDSYGFGDSGGDVIDACIDSQLDNLGTAIDFLKAQTGVDQIVLIGVRLGASIATLFADKHPSIAGLVLIAPIVNGEMYWDSLVRMQQMSFLTRGLKSTTKDLMVEELRVVGHTEIAGDNLSERYIEELQSIKVLESRSSFAGKCIVTAVAADDIASTQARELAERLEQQGAEVAEWVPEPRDFWTSEALYDGYLPLSLYTRTASWLTGE